jgi:hypothetical protein
LSIVPNTLIPPQRVLTVLVSEITN